MPITFDKAFDRLIGHEGKFTANPKDDGNWTGGKQGRGELKGTKYGISAASYPHLDIKNITLADAKLIYRQDFWDVVGKVHDSVKFQLFDAAVNHGRGNAVRFLQRAVQVADDGIWGPRSQSALEKFEKERGHSDILLRFAAYRFKFWASLARFNEFGAGWVIRGADNLLYAAEDN